MKFAHGLLVAFAGLFSYLVLALRFGIYQRYPFAHMLLAAFGIMAMARNTQRSFSWIKLSATLCSAVVLAIFIWWTQTYSTYHNTAPRVVTSVASLTPDFGLKTTAGEAFDFNLALKRAPRTLLVFNRGVW